VGGGLALIDRVIGDGVDPRQFGREVVEYLRGLLLIKEGAGTRLLDATAEQAAEMEKLAAQMSAGQLLAALHLFNEAVTDLKGGLQTLPHLPLEMALVESTLRQVGDHRGSPLPAPGDQGGAVLQAAGDHGGAPLQAPPKASGPVVAQPAAGEASADQGEQAAAATALREEPPRAVLYQTGPGPGAGGGLTLDQVQRRWPEIIGAVQALNKTTAAVLRSNCQPVDLADDQIVVTVPSSILRDKLENPQRKVEIQEAVSSVLGVRSRIRLALATEYAPRAPRPATQSQPQAAAEDLPGQAAGMDGDQVPDEISRWAAERGGQATIVK